MSWEVLYSGLQVRAWPVLDTVPSLSRLESGRGWPARTALASEKGLRRN